MEGYLDIFFNYLIHKYCNEWTSFFLNVIKLSLCVDLGW